MCFLNKKFYFAIFIFTFICNAQVTEKQIDSINSIPFERIVENLRQSVTIFSQNLENARKINYKRGEGIALSNLALTYYLLGQYDKSTEYHIKSFEIFSANNMLKELAAAYGEFGYQLKRRDLEKANEYMQKAIALGRKLKDNNSLLAKIYDNYAVLKEMENKIDSALYFCNLALDIKYKLNDSLGIPFSLNKIAGIYANQKKFKEAFDYLNLSDFYRKKMNWSFGIAENLALRADFHSYQNRLDSAIYYYKLTLRTADSLHYNYLISYALENLSNLYSKKGDYRNAFENLKMFIKYKDSLDNIEKNSRIAQLEIAYETEQKDKIIAQNKLELQQRNLWLVISLISIVLIVSFTTFSYYHLKNKRERELKELEYKKELEKAQLEKKLLDEKLRISRELHDNIGSQLTFIISSIDNLEYSNKSNSNLNLSGLKEFSQMALYDLRNTIWALKEEEADFEKLFLKTNDFIQRLRSAELGIEFNIQNTIEENFSLTSIQMLNLFRIIQEAVQNSVKHASAKNISLLFHTKEKKPIITITDDGKGFNINDCRLGNGIENMKNRAEQSNANLEIVSGEKGTTIQLILN
ncbi:MAG: tetratricopeptide repeat protein [Ignavibacterium sp.]|nr:tetratricopeptide repeat protein [Ignavibacterium sp.]